MPVDTGDEAVGEIAAVERTVTDELEAATEPESDADALLRLRAIEARVRKELARYGIVHADDPLLVGAGGVSMLLRHIYNNRDATFGAKDLTIEFLQNQRNALEAALAEALQGAGQSAEQAQATVETLIREATRTPRERTT